MYHSGSVKHYLKEASTGRANTIGLDLAKNVFQAHGVNAPGNVLFGQKLRRVQVFEFFFDTTRLHGRDGGVWGCALLGTRAGQVWSYRPADFFYRVQPDRLFPD